MTRYRKILRLASLGLSQQGIADSRSVSRKTVNRVLKRAKLPFNYYKEVVRSDRKILQRLDIQESQDHALAAPQSDRIIESLQLKVF